MQPRIERPVPPPQARRAVRHRPAGAFGRARAGSAQPAAVLARQHHRARRRGARPEAGAARRRRSRAAASRSRRRRRCRRPNRTERFCQRSQEPQPPQRNASSGILADAIRNVQKYAQKEGFVNLQGGQNQDFGPSISSTRRASSSARGSRRFVAQVRRNWFIPMAAMTMRGHVVVTFNVHKDGRITDVTVAKPSPVDAFTLSARNAILASNPTAAAAARVPGRQGVLHRHLLLQRKSRRAVTLPTRTQLLGLLIVLAALIALALCCRALLPRRSTASDVPPRSSRSSARRRPARARSASRSRAASTGKSSAATPRLSIAVSTSAPTRCRPPSSRASRITGRCCRSARGVLGGALRARSCCGDPRHHRPRQAADSRRRHRPLLPGADPRTVPGAEPRPWHSRRGSRRSRRNAVRSGCTAGSRGSIRASAERVMPRDLKRIIRALEVYLLTGRPLTQHFAETASALPGYEVTAFALPIPAAETAERVARRVDAQFEQGLLDEIRGLLACGPSRDRTPVQRARLPAGARASARRAGRARDARTHRPREP